MRCPLELVSHCDEYKAKLSKAYGKNAIYRKENAMSLYTLATLAQFRRYLGLPAGDDDRLLLALRAATQALESAACRRFMPYRAALGHTVALHDLRELSLRDDLMELLAVTNGDGQAIPLHDALVLYGGVLHLLRGAFTYEETPLHAVSVLGIWGWHPQPAQAWRAAGDALSAAVNASDTTLSVGAVNGLTADALSPRFSAGQMLRLGEEFMIVLATDAASNTLKVWRGANGTAAAAHAAGAPLAYYAPPPEIVQDCLARAAHLYHEAEAHPAPRAAAAARIRL
jgi:hypothetical protein